MQKFLWNIQSKNFYENSWINKSEFCHALSQFIFDVIDISFVLNHSCFILNFHERTEHVLPMDSNCLQSELNDLHSYTIENLMKINVNKTKIMLFNTSKSYDFPPELSLPTSSTYLHVVEQTRLLGLQISTDLRWADHTGCICKKANARLWMLRRMKLLNIETEIILDFYFKEIRSILEMGCQIFHSGLTKNQSRDIENIQKKALKIILGRLYSCYEEACTLLSCEPLSDRRDTLCLKFIRKAVKRGQHQNIFIPATSNNKTRSNKQLLKEYTCNTQRFYNSPLVYLSRIHNKNLR